MKIPLRQFKEEVTGYNSFTVRFENPLFPVGVSMGFDQLYANLFDSPHVRFKKNCSESGVCLSHIKAVDKRKSSDSGKIYIFTCMNHLPQGDPEEIYVHVECSKKI